MDKFGKSQSVRRFEDNRFITGRGGYVDDVAPAGALHAVFVRSQVAHGALSRLLSMSKEEWYDPAEARERKMFFAIAMSEARALADKDFLTGDRRVQMSPMA